MNCPRCGAVWVANAPFCGRCGWQPTATGEDNGQNAGLRMLLPVGRSWLAIVAGYLGLFSILVLPAPLALIFGILAVRDIRKHPETHGMGRAIFGIVMGGLFTLLPILFGLLSFVFGRSGP